MLLGRVVALLLVVLVVSCSSNGDGAQPSAPSDGEALCALIEQQRQTMGSFDAGSPENARAVEQAQVVAPPELAGHLEVMADALTAMAELRPEAPGAAERLDEIVGDPDYLAAGEAMQRFLDEDCNMDVDVDVAATEPEVSELEAHVDRRYDDHDDDFFDRDDVPAGDDDGWVDSRHLGLWLDEHHADADWYQQRPSRFSNPESVGLMGDFTDEQATDACDALVTYLAELDIDASVTVVDWEGVVVADDNSGTCAAT